MTVASLLSLVFYTVVLMAVVAWGAGFGLWPILRRWKAVRCPRLSGSTWLLLATAPLTLGLAVGLASQVSALLKGFSVIPDHCSTHSGHPHFCWTGAHTLLPQEPLAWTVLAAAGAFLLLSLAKVARSLIKVNRRMRSAAGAVVQDGLVIIPSRIPAAFVAGVLRPQAYLTSAAFQLLSPAQRSIVALHEREHIRRHHPLKLTVLRVVSSLFPGFRWLEEKWKEEVELECDRACIANGAAPEDVSLTILKLARSLSAYGETSVLAYASGSESVLRRRVERLLSADRPQPPRLERGVLFFVLWVLLVIGLAIEHHVMETVVGLFVS